MSNSIVRYSQFKGTAWFTTKEPLLQHAGFVALRRGDLTLQFSNFARGLMQAMDGTDVEIQIERFTYDNNRKLVDNAQRITVYRPGHDGKALPPEQLQLLLDYVEHFVSRDDVIDERALLEHSRNLQAAYANAHGEYSSKMKQYVEEVFVPERRKSTGHDAGMEFIGFVPDGNDKALSAITFSNGCQACAMSFKNSLTIGNDVIGAGVDTMKAQNIPGAPAELSGIMVLPNERGSPSAIFRRKPQPLSQHHAVPA